MSLSRSIDIELEQCFDREKRSPFQVIKRGIFEVLIGIGFF